MGEHRHKQPGAKAPKEPAVSTIERKVPMSRVKELSEAWDEVQEAQAKVQEVCLERDRAILSHGRKLRAALKEQGAPVTHSIDMDTGVIFDPAKRRQQGQG